VVTQLRRYTIREGMMDSWIALFTQTIKPLTERCGMSIDGMWVDEARREFIWLRSFGSVEDIPVKEALFTGTPEYADFVPKAKEHLARYDVTLMSPVS
jgi:NIPSNAP protein